MFDYLLHLDQKIFIFLNGLGATPFDGFWLFLTKQINWTPFFLVLLYLVYKKFDTKQTLFLIVFIAVLVLFSDQTCNLVKNIVQRERPCNTEVIKSVIRIVKTSDTYSFYSGHAANSAAVTVFLYLLLRKKYSLIGFAFCWPILFGYSRIYLGLHYPLDILSGYIAGTIFGFGFYRVYTNNFKKSLKNSTNR